MLLKAKILNIDPAVQEAKRKGREEVYYYNSYCLLREKDGNLIETTSNGKEIRTILEITWTKKDLDKIPKYYNEFQEIEIEIDPKDILVSKFADKQKRTEFKEGKTIESHIKKMYFSNLKSIKQTSINANNPKKYSALRTLSELHPNQLARLQVC